MRTVVIGGTGHIGSWLVPELVQARHETIVVSRGDRRPYGDALGSDAQALWDDVHMVRCDRQRAERDGVFGTTIAALRPDAVVDLTCFTSEQSHQLVDALDGQQLVQTGSIWSYGASEVVPTREDAPRHPFGDYGLGKLAVEQHLLHEQRRVRASVVRTPATSAVPAGGPSAPRPTSMSP